MLTQPTAGEEAVTARQVKNGAAWFYWIAGLTVLNVVTILCGLSWTFLLSLLLPIFIADTSYREHDSGEYISTALVTAFSAWIYLLLGRAAQKGARWAFITGIIFYGLDTLFWIGAKEGRALGLILHVAALFGMGRGLGAAKRWDALRRRNAPQAHAPTVDAPAQALESQALEAQIQAQSPEMQAQEAAAPVPPVQTSFSAPPLIPPLVLPKTPPQTPVAFSEIDALDTRIDAPDTKIGAPSTRVDALDNEVGEDIDDRIDAPEV